MLKGPTLLLDVASRPIEVIIWPDGERFKERVSLRDAGHALQSLFTLLDEGLAQTGLELRHLRHLLFNRGPGSAMALRQGLVALKAWHTAIHPSPRIGSFRKPDLIAASWIAKNPEEPSSRLIWALKPGMWVVWDRDREPHWDAGLPASQILADSTPQALFAGSQAQAGQPDDWPDSHPFLQPALNELLGDEDEGWFRDESSFPSLCEPPVREYVRWNSERHGS